MRYFKHLGAIDRARIERLYTIEHCKIPDIAKIMRVHISTIYRELKRGEYYRIDPRTYEYFKSYSCNIAQGRYSALLKCKGIKKKITENPELAAFIERKIVNDKYSPHAAIVAIRENDFKTKICERTIYNYINSGVFGSIRMSELPYRRKKKRRRKIKIVNPSLVKDKKTIDNRPNIDDRSEFGHWEIDTVIGRKNEKCCIFVMTERKTRQELIFKIDDRTSRSVSKIIDQLEAKFGLDNFKKIFKSFTSDNGREFLMTDLLERSNLKDKEKRIELYYAHPYSSYERGSNENNNKLIRRHIPKGRSFKDKSQKDMDRIADWINHYPRKLFQDKSSSELFNSELLKLNLEI